MRVLRRLVALTLLLALAGAAPAEGHAALLGTRPAPESRLPRAPAAVALRFGEPVVAGPRALVVTDGRGRRVSGASRERESTLGAPLRRLPPVGAGGGRSRGSRGSPGGRGPLDRARRGGGPPRHCSRCSPRCPPRPATQPATTRLRHSSPSTSCTSPR